MSATDDGELADTSNDDGAAHRAALRRGKRLGFCVRATGVCPDSVW